MLVVSCGDDDNDEDAQTSSSNQNGGNGSSDNGNGGTPAFDGKDKVFTVNGVSFKMIAVKGGTFQMGSNDGYDNEKPVHAVTLSDYYIGETEVTQ
ncbi:MAG: SUMF1/EgtB/PvdO family nonheme iron enzyme, partial [Bacteroidales bacterium]|nr:SUMF1/EgtB/PvdO family nonheme iron enzyme [Bacteroidales bacterium]